MSKDAYWEKKYDKFIEVVLKDEQEKYKRMIEAIEEEANYLKKYKEEYLKDNPEDFVVYLYINHELNRLDPIGCIYPGISNEYSSYAWEILDLYRKQKGKDFEDELMKYIYTIYESTGSSKPGIENVYNTTRRIIKHLKELYKK